MIILLNYKKNIFTYIKKAKAIIVVIVELYYMTESAYSKNIYLFRLSKWSKNLLGKIEEVFCLTRLFISLMNSIKNFQKQIKII